MEQKKVAVALVLSSLVVLCLVCVGDGKRVVIDNMKPRVDIHGNIMDAHDGSIQRFDHLNDGLYYYHAMSYGLCKEPKNYGCDQTVDRCGFQQTHNISIWSSPDLKSWTYRANAIAIDKRPAGIVFRPHLVYNPNTKLFVLWWNYVGTNGQYAGYAVATSPSPLGPFVLQVTQVNVTRTKGGDGDFALFVDKLDPHYSAYVIYGADYWMSIEKLTPDYLASTGIVSNTGPNNLFPDYFIEAPVIFLRGKTYYTLYGHCCCFCEQGSGIMVLTAQNMLGPWTKQAGGDLACRDMSRGHVDDWILKGIPTPGQGCLYNNSKTVSITRSQQNYVVEVLDPDTKQVTFVWTGDRWQQAPDGIKGHDPQYWTVLSFDSNGAVGKVSWENEISFNV